MAYSFIVFLTSMSWMVYHVQVCIIIGVILMFAAIIGGAAELRKGVKKSGVFAHTASSCPICSH
jgi:hypothetical protein